MKAARQSINKLGQTNIQSLVLSLEKIRQQQTKKVPKDSSLRVYQAYLATLAPTSKKTVESLLRKVCSILGWKGAVQNYPWHELDYGALVKVRAELQEQKYAIKSINLTINCLRSMAKTAFNLGVMESSNLMRLQAIKPVRGEVLKKGRCLGQEEIQKILDKCCGGKSNRNKRDKALLLLGVSTGMRKSELINIRVEDICLEQGLVKVLHAKGNKQRQLYVGKQVVDALDAWIKCIDRQGVLFSKISKSDRVLGNKLSHQGFAKIVHGWHTKAKITAFCPHDFRRTFISRLLADGTELQVISALVSHANIVSTSSYDRRNLEELKKVTSELKWGIK